MIETNYPCAHCEFSTYMNVEEHWWCSKHNMYDCEMEGNRGLCEKFKTITRAIQGRNGGRRMNIEIKSVPFSWNDNFSEVALEDFQQIQKGLSYLTCQSIGLALAKLKLLEKQGCKVDEAKYDVEVN